MTPANATTASPSALGTNPRKLFQRNRRIVRAYQQDGATLAEIAAQHGLSFGRIRQILESQGVDRRPKGGYFAKHRSAA